MSLVWGNLDVLMASMKATDLKKLRAQSQFGYLNLAISTWLSRISLVSVRYVPSPYLGDYLHTQS